jgi:hypothetical protein
MKQLVQTYRIKEYCNNLVLGQRKLNQTRFFHLQSICFMRCNSVGANTMIPYNGIHANGKGESKADPCMAITG